MPAAGANRKLKNFTEVPRDLWSRKGVQTRKIARGLTGTLIIGDDTGLIKVVSCKRKKLIKLWGQQNPVKRIKKLYWAHSPTHNITEIEDTKKEFLAILSNGDIRLYNSLVGSYTTPIKQEADIQGLYVMDNPCLVEEDKKRMVWTVNNNGDCRLWGLDYNKDTFVDEWNEEQIVFPTDTMILNQLPPKEKKSNSSNKDMDSFIDLLKSQRKKKSDKNSHAERGVLLSHFNINAIQRDEKLQQKQTNGDDTTTTKHSIANYPGLRSQKRNRNRLFTRSYPNQKGKIKCMKGHYLPSQFPWIAMAGNDRPVEIYDFNKQKCVFRGEHHYHYLGYKHEVIINDLDWGKKSVNPYLCAAVTSQSELKLYDLRSRKSIFAQRINDYSLNKVKVKSQKKVLIGDSNSNVWEFDYLKPAKIRGLTYRRFRGFVGAIRDFDIHPTRNLLASVGLGRYAVVHRFNAPHLPLLRLYLKQKLNAVLFNDTRETEYLPEEKEQSEERPEEPVDAFLDDDEEEEAKEEVVAEDEDDEEVVDELEDHDEEDEEDDDDDDDDDDGVDDEADLNERLDGYDTDELQELLEDLKARKDSDDDGNEDSPPLKKRKLDE